jgi:hypothetical protein
MKIVTTLLIWIAAHSAWEVPEDRPQISYEPAEFIRQVTGTLDSNTLPAVAAYDHRTNIILLNEHFTPTDVRQEAILMHELVHWLQDEYPYRTYQCRNKWEEEAYELTNLYLEQRGEEPWTNRLTILFHSMCKPRM